MYIKKISTVSNKINIKQSVTAQDLKEVVPGTTRTQAGFKEARL